MDGKVEEVTGGSALSPHPVGGSHGYMGGRHRKSHKKLRLVKKKTVRRMLAKHGLKMRGGGDTAATAAVVPPKGGRRRKSHKKSRRGMFF
jgi:hypothetical protein